MRFEKYFYDLKKNSLQDSIEYEMNEQNYKFENYFQKMLCTLSTVDFQIVTVSEIRTQA